MPKVTIRQEVLLMIKRANGLQNFSDRFFKKHQSEYHTIGLAKLHSDVYLKFAESPDYERTRNLLLSFNSEINKDGMRIFLDPTQSDIKAKKPGGYKYYPAYVSEGRFFRTQGIPREIAQGWESVLGNRFEKDVRKEIKQVIRVV